MKQAHKNTRMLIFIIIIIITIVIIIIVIVDFFLGHPVEMENLRNLAFFPQVQFSDSYPPISLSLVKTYWRPVEKNMIKYWIWWNQEYKNIGMAKKREEDNPLSSLPC